MVDHREDACPICGHTDYTWGKLVGYRAASFIGEETSFLRKFFLGVTPVSARKCKGCMNLQLFDSEAAK